MFESLRYLIPGQARRDFRDGEAMFRDGIDPLTLRISQYPYWKYRGYVNAAQRDEIRRLRNHTEALQAKITMMDAAWSQGWHCGLMDAPDGLTTEPPRLLPSRRTPGAPVGQGLRRGTKPLPVRATRIPRTSGCSSVPSWSYSLRRHNGRQHRRTICSPGQRF